MGASVSSSSLTPSAWTSTKPAAYKGGQDLEKALTSYQALAGKTVKVPGNLIPPVPKSTIKDFDDCIAHLKNAIAELEKGKVILNQIGTALKAVVTAANKTAADLDKAAKSPNVDTAVFENAATSCHSISTLATTALKDYV
jgi:exonuclease VII small subunit